MPFGTLDILHFCSNYLQFYPVGIDTTFNLGEFYVRSLILENADDTKSPTLVGLTLIHMSRSYSVFCHLAAKLKKIEFATLSALLPMVNRV